MRVRASNLPASVQLGASQLRAGRGERGVRRWRRAIDGEAPGSVWNAALRPGGLVQSCTQANRANSIRGMPSRFCKCAKREPSSLRVAFAVLDEYASAKPPPLSL
jgi:hypothetical protein